MNQELLNLTELYFKAFKEKNIELLKSLYSEEVSLVDWTGQWYGSESVLLSNSELFENDYELVVNYSKLVDNTTYNSITIRFDSGPIDVLDVISFDENNKIHLIRAYKG